MRPTCMVESPITLEKHIDFRFEMSRIQPLRRRQQTVENILLDILKNLEYYNRKLYMQAL
jgi:translation initiation factor 2 beta subunit (eIF-2beta)/eIF-5